MSAERKTVHERIEESLADTERLLSQKQYTLSMMRARQTLETIVKSLCRRNGISDGDLVSMIDDLQRKGVISRETCANFHNIRLIGNKAAHEGDNNACHANTSLQLLEQAVYGYRNAKRQRKTALSGLRHRKRKKRVRGRFLILLPLLFLLLLLPVFRRFHSSDHTETSPVSVPSAQETTPSVPETVSETEPNKLYTTTASLNVRSAPTVDGDLLTTLPAGTVLHYIGPHDSQWSIIDYNGGQAYVASQYISVSEMPFETETDAESDSLSSPESASQSEN